MQELPGKTEEGKRPRESRFGCGRCDVVLSKGAFWHGWHTEPMEDD